MRVQHAAPGRARGSCWILPGEVRMSERKVDILPMLANVPLRAPTGKKRILVATTDHNVSLPAELDATAAAELIGTMAVDVPEAVRGFVENAIAFAVPAQTRLGRVVRGEVP